jgi:hypothetical protein
MFKAVAPLAVSLAFIASPVIAAKPVDDAVIGAAFIETCVRPAPDDAALKAALDRRQPEMGFRRSARRIGPQA